MTKLKVCRKCKNSLPLEVFVDSAGSTNPRGAYCKACHVVRLEEWRRSALTEEASHIPKLQIVYGTWWKHYAIPEDFLQTLLDERDYCPYCHTKFSEVIPTKFNPCQTHLDHMDPLDRGGEHSIRNTVYCCGPCNIKKGNIKFSDWLKKLPPDICKSAEQIYIEKHGHRPEEFTEGCPTSKGMWPEMAIYSTMEDLQMLYPEPVVNGPPSNQPIVITLDVSKGLKL